MRSFDQVKDDRIEVHEWQHNVTQSLANIREKRDLEKVRQRLINLGFPIEDVKDSDELTEYLKNAETVLLDRTDELVKETTKITNPTSPE